MGQAQGIARVPEEMKEGGRVGAGFIQAISTDRQAPSFQMACGQRGFSRAEQHGNLAERTCAGLGAEPKEARPLEQHRQRRRR